MTLPRDQQPPSRAASAATGDYSAQWREILDRHKRGRRLLLFHLVASPALVYLLGYIASAVIGREPVFFYAIAFVAWVVVLVSLIRRHEPYRCPRCGTSVHPSGAVSLLPLPCSKCGLTMPLAAP